MTTWLHVALIVFCAGGGFALYVVLETPVQDAMIRAARGSVWRALAVVLVYYTINLVAAYAIWTIAQTVSDRGHATSMALILGIGMLVLSPSVFMYYRRWFGAGGDLSVTERSGLERLGADRGVARAIAWPGGFLSIVMAMAMFWFGLFILTGG